MHLNNISSVNFRNYKNLYIELSKGINIIYGNNAQGKTNLLESIYVLSTSKSHRSFIDSNLIKNGESICKIKGQLEKEEIKTIFSVDIDKKQKKMKIDEKEIKKLSEYMSQINIIIFYPEDLELIKGSPSIRRRYLNIELSQLSGGYLEILNDYNKLLKIRNDLLKKQNKKEDIDQNYFNIITEYLIKKASTIYKMRKKFIDMLNYNCKNIFLNISGLDKFTVEYENNLNTDDYSKENIEIILKNKLNSSLSNDIRLGLTTFGPHRDDIGFYLDGYNIKNYGSQGQQRMSILTLKLSEIFIFKKNSGTTPILLLDDVFSELDDEKKNNLLKYIDSDIQTIITTTDLKSINESILNKAKIFEIKEGTIKYIEKVK